MLFAVIYSYDRPYALYLNEEQIVTDNATARDAESILRLDVLETKYIKFDDLWYLIIRVR